MLAGTRKGLPEVQGTKGKVLPRPGQEGDAGEAWSDEGRRRPLSASAIGHRAPASETGEEDARLRRRALGLRLRWPIEAETEAEAKNSARDRYPQEATSPARLPAISLPFPVGLLVLVPIPVPVSLAAPSRSASPGRPDAGIGLRLWAGVGLSWQLRPPFGLLLQPTLRPAFCL